MLRRSLILLSVVAVVQGASSAPVMAERQGLLSRIGGGAIIEDFSWSDEIVFQGWRVRRNAVVGHYKLVDPNGERYAFGTFDDCLTKFKEIKADRQLPTLPEHVVVVLHGLGATKRYMNGLAEYLQDYGGLTVVNVNYPSTMDEIDEHAASLDSVIRHLDGAKQISFVAHSMGNIVVRRYLHDIERLSPNMRPPVEFKRMVMIAPPNHGAVAADKLGQRKIVQMLGGKAVEQLAPNGGWPELEQKLATPDFEFGIIVGGRANDTGYLPGIPGDDDMLLSIDTMKLAGASDFIQTKGVHQMMAQYKEVRVAALEFLQHGYFVSEESRRPILAEAPPAPPE